MGFHLYSCPRLWNYSNRLISMQVKWRKCLGCWPPSVPQPQHSRISCPWISSYHFASGDICAHGVLKVLEGLSGGHSTIMVAGSFLLLSTESSHYPPRILFSLFSTYATLHCLELCSVHEAPMILQSSLEMSYVLVVVVFHRWLLLSFSLFDCSLMWRHKERMAPEIGNDHHL